MTAAGLPDRVLLEQCSDAWLNPNHTERCGEENGQPRWNECDDKGVGVWRLYGFDRPYCTKHAANRIRSRTSLHAQWHQRPDHTGISDPMWTGLVLLGGLLLPGIFAVAAWSMVGDALDWMNTVGSTALQAVAACTAAALLWALLVGIARLADSGREALR
jgi:hypothetical protein